MWLLYVKALHIIFVVTWFAGLFYIVRLFVYHREAEQYEGIVREAMGEQYKLMQRRLWFGITWPSALLAMGTGFLLLYGFGYWRQPWMWVKLVFMVGLFGYHLSCHWILQRFQKDELVYTSTQLRIWNEVATLFLVAIVFLVVLKDTLSFLWGLLGLVIFTLVLLVAIRVYRSARLRSQKKKEA
jgi:putative membrane protein